LKPCPGPGTVGNGCDAETTDEAKETHAARRGWPPGELMTSPNPRRRVAIVGAGFGGLAVARSLRNELVDVVVVDRTNYHLFQPLLYQVATAALQPGDIAYPVRGALRRISNATFRLAEVTTLSLDRKSLATAKGDAIGFDELVLAAGATTATFGVAGADDHAFPLKTIEDALRLRRHLLLRFEHSYIDRSMIEQGMLNTVVVGGGPTGVEMAGALAELYARVLARDFPGLDVSRARIFLVELEDDVLTSFHPRSRSHAAAALRTRGIRLLLNRGVVAVHPDGIALDDGDVIPAGTVVWAAGGRAAGLASTRGVATDPAGRIVTRPDLSVDGWPAVWAIGDIALVPQPDGEPLPQLAPVALQQGRHAAAQMRRRWSSEPTTPFAYRDKGIMATIGRRAAVAEIGPGLRFRGTLGWLVWLFLHLVQLIGFRNRASVLIDWTWNYLTWERHSRLIIPTETSDETPGRPTGRGDEPPAGRTEPSS
jgi:NADH:ubiquinone reductase (H+-translocating)